MSTLGVDTHLKEGLGWEPVVVANFVQNNIDVAGFERVKKNI